MLLETKVHDVFGLGQPFPVEQEVGIEIEIEGENVLHEGILSYWLIDKDGSLRGDSAEYKLKAPVPREKVLPVLLYLYRKLGEHQTRIKDSQRTGVHVHVNVQTCTLKELYQFITLYFCVEELMVRVAGKDRVGNLFCLRASDAEGVIEYLVSAMKNNNFRSLYQDNLRYSSLNVKALQQFGSLEFRALRGGLVTPQEIATWTKMLLEIKDAALRFENPRAIIEAVSGQGPEKFVKDIGPTIAHHLVAIFPEPIGELVYTGVRQAQEIAYCNKWAKKKPPENQAEVGVDPDQRDVEEFDQMLRFIQQKQMARGEWI